MPSEPEMAIELRQILEGLKARVDVIDQVVHRIVEAEFEDMEGLLDSLGVSNADASQSDAELQAFVATQLKACWNSSTIRPQVNMTINRLSGGEGGGEHRPSRLVFSRNWTRAASEFYAELIKRRPGYTAQGAAPLQPAPVGELSTAELFAKVREEVESESLQNDKRHTYHMIWLDQQRTLGSMYK